MSQGRWRQWSGRRCTRARTATARAHESWVTRPRRQGASRQNAVRCKCARSSPSPGADVQGRPVWRQEGVRKYRVPVRAQWSNPLWPGSIQTGLRPRIDGRWYAKGRRGYSRCRPRRPCASTGSASACAQAPRQRLGHGIPHGTASRTGDRSARAERTGSSGQMTRLLGRARQR